MKAFNKYLVFLFSMFLLGSILAIVGCNDDEGEPTVDTNGFNIDGNFFKTDFGYLRDNEVGGTILFKEIYLSSEQLDINRTDLLDAEFNSLDIVVFSVIPTNDGELPTGTIEHANLNIIPISGIRFLAGLTTDANINEDNATNYNIVDGEMDINISNGDYEITYRLIDENNITIEGEFKGALIE